MILKLMAFILVDKVEILEVNITTTLCSIELLRFGKLVFTKDALDVFVGRLA